MEKVPEKKRLNPTVKYILIFAAVGVIGFLLWYFMNIVAYILIALVFSFIGRPLVELIRKTRIGKFKIPGALSAALVLLLIWFAIFIFFRFFIPVIAQEAQTLASIDVQEIKENLEEPLEQAKTVVEKFQITNDEDVSIEEYLSQKIISLLNVSNLSNLFAYIAGMLGDIFIAIFSISFMAFFFLKDTHLFSNAIILLVPSTQEEHVKHILSSSRKLLSRYFVGLIIQISLIILLVTIGLSIIGMKINHVVVIALFVGLMNVIPYVGPSIGAVVGIILGIATNLHLDFYSEIIPLTGYMAIVFLSVQIIDNIVFQPLIYANSVNAHPLEIFIVIMMAGSIAGIAGMILAIPAYTVIRIIAKEFFSKIKLVRKLTENI